MSPPSETTVNSIFEASALINDGGAAVLEYQAGMQLTKLIIDLAV